MIVRGAALAAAVLATVACASGKSTSEPARPTGRVVLTTAAGARHAVAVEVARTPESRTRGLMYREKLDPDAGMLFVFDESEPHGFWMKNTLIPLDMIFIDDTGRIVGIVENAEPRTLTTRDVGAPSRYVLEVNGGWAKAHGIARGDMVRFEGVQ
ncbi:DUF192 domain-containing protein [Anaeromyxobacter oryzae]|uniref:DUF192 domain-containing protein n=1 Tax=Anaeromyxobacter oryzae TaxID=2918170 RepID=A0ABM7WZF7_9BACT|nr:DUF192 domain-containing protein [Anaeromyxobacter oryzae]BDG04926.1 hypothetical protein AMOR_39220 [Anaeromyxobacter oryzae]